MGIKLYPNSWKKISITIILSIIVVLGILLAIEFAKHNVAQAANANEVISEFKTEIKINSDASFEVQERIVYNFGTAQKHGIFREIPLFYSDKDERTYKLEIDGVGIFDQENKPVKYSLSTENDTLNIKIGDADVLITGTKVYNINYRVKNGINYYDDGDELYWNATGNFWGAKILNASAQVWLPAGVTSEMATAVCYQGALSSKESCKTEGFGMDMDYLPVPGSTTTTPAEGFEYGPVTLTPKNGMSISARWQSGFITRTPKEEFGRTAGADWSLRAHWKSWLLWCLILPLAVFAILFKIWRKYGRGPKMRKPIIAQYDLPCKITPLLVNLVAKNRAGEKYLAAELIQLAIDGYLKINQLITKGIFGKKIDYELEKLKAADGQLFEHQKELLGALFKDRDKLLLSDLKKTNWLDAGARKYRTQLAKAFLKVKGKLAYKEMKEQGWTLRDSMLLRNVSLIIPGSLLGFISFFYLISWLFTILGAQSEYNYSPKTITASIGLLLTGLLLIIFGNLMAQLTEAGMRVKEHLLGLKLYLAVAEKDRINFHNAPEKNPAIFEKFLPYAIIFKLEKKWAEQFKDINITEPEWYHGTSGASFNSVIFVSALSSFSNGLTMTTGGNSASVGGSGGGAGGGGGGSW